jgi:hypothetical protein
MNKMGKLHNFNSIKFKPFEYREGNIKVTNFYMDKITGKKKTLQSHLPYPAFSFFEILYVQKNIYYGKEEEMIKDGYSWSWGGSFLQKDNVSIDKSCFVNEESSYMLAHWDNVDHDEKTPDIRFVGPRPMELSEEEQVLFMRLAKIGQVEIERQLNALDEDDF